MRSVLDLQASRVNEIVLVDVNVRIIDHHKPPLRLRNLLIQLLHFIHGPRFSIEDEILHVLRVVQIRPQHINWESISRELFITSHHKVCTVLFPFAVVVTQSMDRRNWWVAGHFGEQSLVTLRSLGRTEDKKLEYVTD